MRVEHALVAYCSTTFLLKDPCPVCGAETALAEVEPHPMHSKFEIHGYYCDRCGPVKSVVVLRSQPH
jgi:C4-type Zn-finger protein